MGHKGQRQKEGHPRKDLGAADPPVSLSLIFIIYSNAETKRIQKGDLLIQ
jgi:hypothetical protein